MTRPPDRLAAQRATKPRWKPPIGLLELDILASLMLAVGLLLQFAPESPIARVLPAEARLPLLVVGGALLALSAFAIIRSAIGARRRS
jgi:hypothetical protein